VEHGTVLSTGAKGRWCDDGRGSGAGKTWQYVDSRECTAADGDGYYQYDVWGKVGCQDENCEPGIEGKATSRTNFDLSPFGCYAHRWDQGR